LTGFHTALPILDLDPLDHQIGALPESHLILAEPSILRFLGYKMCAAQIGQQVQIVYEAY
ncbi:hypothetical protein, partial [Vibrio nigripulchritudo]|uniref:hypothetical protein n=1 Tax=Vibrio nigripulchritudo TaxID=28173 RepID=UPI00066AE9C7